MTLNASLCPFDQFFGLDGKPLENGYVYIGVVGLDPVANPVPIFYDAALTIPAPNPMRTITGYVSNAGTPANVFTSGNYSIKVADKNNVQIYYVSNFLLTTNFSDLRADLAASSGSSLIGFIQAGIGAVSRVLQSKVREPVSSADFGTTGLGVVDESPSFTLAFNAASGRQILITPGTYLLNTAVTAPTGSCARIQKGVIFTGAGSIDGAVFEYDTGRASGTAGSKSKIDRLVEYSKTLFPLENVGSYWTALTYFFQGFSKTFGSADGGSGSPVATTFTYAVNNGSSGDVCAGIDMAVVQSNTGSKAAFGRNIIAACGATITSAKMVGLEIDIEPSVGATSSGSGGALYINGFNLTNLGPAIQIGGIGGGTFNNGILLGAISGAGIAAQPSSTMVSLIDSSQGAYTGQAINLGNQHTIQFRANGGGAGCILVSDTGDNLSASVKSAFLIKGSNTNEGSPLLSVADSGGVQSLVVQVARGAPSNAANSAIKINGQSITGRSISAGGTINASGADYAEYELKSESCEKIEKGAIVGFDSNGNLTDIFSKSISFAVKSTNPNLVGGDDWGSSIGLPPIAPNPPSHPGSRPIREETNRVSPEVLDYEFLLKIENWENEVNYFNAKNDEYLKLKLSFDDELKLFEFSLAEERKKVDRIAYCGKVPVNVIGANIGDYIIPVNKNGLIVGESVSNPTFSQYQISVGRVRKILQDGRAQIVVKPI
jgi:hypothetical protein